MPHLEIPQSPMIDRLIEQARNLHGRIAIPDAQFDERVMVAATEVHRLGWVDVVLVGSRRACRSIADKAGLELDGIQILDAEELPRFSEFCETYGRIRAKDGLTDEQIESTMRDPAYLACMAHREGLVDAVCSGVHYSTRDIARPALRTLGLSQGVKTMTAASVATFDRSPIGDDLAFVTADATIVPTPDAQQLSEIAILTADAAEVLLEDRPRVAMLSFSTTGSAQHESVDKVVRALELVRRRRPDILIDGEFQIDAALMPSVAEKKVGRASEVAGRANVLIWPSLEAGNIGSKSLMMMGEGRLVGATFLGLDGLVGDHSRGATIEEIISYIAYIGAQVPASTRSRGD